MNSPANLSTVVHVLSVKRGSDGSIRVRATLRTGDVHPGQILSFSTPTGEQHKVLVQQRKDGPRHITLTLDGTGKEDAAALNSGYYLFG